MGIVLHMRYTAREGGGALRGGAIAHINNHIAAGAAAGSSLLLSARHDFATGWAKFMAHRPAGSARAKLTLDLRAEHYPFWSRTTSTKIEIFAVAEPLDEAAPVEIFYAAEPAADGNEVSDTLLPDGSPGELAGGRLTHMPSDKPIQEIDLYLNDAPTIKNLWLVVKATSQPTP